MTEIDVYRPPLRAEVAVPAANDTDSWVAVVQDILKIANVVYDTPFVPDGLRGSAPAVAACMLAGREMGLGIMTSLANIDVIKGKPTQKALLMRAMIQGRGHKWQDVDVTDTRAVVRGCRMGESEWTEVAFTADQAKRAGIDLGKYPADKLYARATSRLARRKFADVIMGMPYSSEELEDGDVMEDGDVPAAGTAAPAIEAPKARTARRQQAARDPSPAPAAPAATAAPAPRQGAGEALPPLPGEEEDPTAAPPRGTASPPSSSAPDDTGYDTPGTVSTPQITAIWTVLSNVYHFTRDEKDQARVVCAHIIGRDLDSTKDLSRNEAKTILDTLSHWQYGAEKENQHPRDYMTALMIAQDPDAAAADGE